jgi:hypothetical protein
VERGRAVKENNPPAVTLTLTTDNKNAVLVTGISLFMHASPAVRDAIECDHSDSKLATRRVLRVDVLASA